MLRHEVNPIPTTKISYICNTSRSVVGDVGADGVVDARCALVIPREDIGATVEENLHSRYREPSARQHQWRGLKKTEKKSDISKKRANKHRETEATKYVHGPGINSSAFFNEKRDQFCIPCRCRTVKSSESKVRLRNQYNKRLRNHNEFPKQIKGSYAVYVQPPSRLRH